MILQVLVSWVDDLFNLVKKLKVNFGFYDRNKACSNLSVRTALVQLLSDM